MNLPTSPYDRNLTEDETQQLISEGWRVSHSSICYQCYARGCEKCYGIGVVTTLMNGNEYYFGTPPSLGDSRGGALRMDIHHDGKVYLSVQGFAGSYASIVMTLPQAWRIMQNIVNATANEFNGKTVELGVEFKCSGPPVMSLAGLRSRNQSNRRPSKRQQKAISLLKGAGMDKEANLLRQACAHDCFVEDPTRTALADQALTKMKPGTIFERRGGQASIISGGKITTVNVDKSVSMLGLRLSEEEEVK